MTHFGGVMEILFIAIFALVFIFISWLLNFLTNNDTSKLFGIGRIVYTILLPLSCFLWIYEVIVSRNWFNKDGFTSFICVGNLIMTILLIIIRTIFKKARSKEPYYKRQNDFSHKHMEQQLNMFFVLVIVVIPILNIYSVIYFIKTYLLQ